MPLKQAFWPLRKLARNTATVLFHILLAVEAPFIFLSLSNCKFSKSTPCCSVSSVRANNLKSPGDGERA